MEHKVTYALLDNLSRRKWSFPYRLREGGAISYCYRKSHEIHFGFVGSPDRFKFAAGKVYRYETVVKKEWVAQ